MRLRTEIPKKRGEGEGCDNCNQQKPKLPRNRRLKKLEDKRRLMASPFLEYTQHAKNIKSAIGKHDAGETTRTETACQPVNTTSHKLNKVNDAIILRKRRNCNTISQFTLKKKKKNNMQAAVIEDAFD